MHKNMQLIKKSPSYTEVIFFALEKELFYLAQRGV